MHEIWEVLEATAVGRKANAPGIPRTAVAEPMDVTLWKRSLLRFLEEIDGDLSVSEVREALEQYNG